MRGEDRLALDGVLDEGVHGPEHSTPGRWTRTAPDGVLAGDGQMAYNGHGVTREGALATYRGIGMAETGFVAFLDVLGFSRLVTRDDSREVLDRYRSCIEVVEKPAEEACAQVRYVVFSDSILLYIGCDAPDGPGRRLALWLLLVRTAALYRQLLLDKFPVRGAVAYGRFESLPEGGHGVIVAGRPIVEAHRYEERQNWIGIMLTPSTLEALGPKAEEILKSQSLPKRRFPPWQLLVRKAKKIPFHDSEDPYSGWAVLPISGEGCLLPELPRELDQAIHALNIMKALAPDPGAQKKYNTTTQWLGEAKASISKEVDPAKQQANS